MPDLVSALGVPLALLVALLLFGASIFVHELGHFLAARRLGLDVPRFSIGFGPKLLAWRRGGTEYRISLLPLGGYVALPQLADLSAIEGDDEAAPPSRPLRFREKVQVLVAGALFNLLFAFAVACVVWALGRPTSAQQQTTVVGWVAPTLGEPAEEGGEAPVSPAKAAGLRPGDRIVAVDGRAVDDFAGLTTALVAGTGRDASGNPKAVLTVERDGRTIELDLHPRIDGPDRLRRIGVSPAGRFSVHSVLPDSPAALAGLREGDRVTRLGDEPLLSLVPWFERTRDGQPLVATVEREGTAPFAVTLQPVEVVYTTGGDKTFDTGLRFRNEVWREHVPPHEQVTEAVSLTVRFLQALLHRGSDVGVQQMSGPVGIFSALVQTVRFDFASFLALGVLVNVNLALLNLLPIPVLDGGQIAFALAARLRGRPLPARLVNGVQGAFVFLFLGLMAYVTLFDVRRTGRDLGEERSWREEQERQITPVFPKP